MGSLGGALGAISPYLQVAQLGAGLLGLGGASSARKREEERRRALLRDLSLQFDREYQDLVGENSQRLYATTGQAGDALETLGRRLGSANAEAGVYNSSATSGLLAHAKSEADGTIADLAQRNLYNEKSLLRQNQRHLTGQQLGVASEDLGRADATVGGAANGLTSFLGALTQANLAKGNVPNANRIGPAMNGNHNGTLSDVWAGMPGMSWSKPLPRMEFPAGGEGTLTGGLPGNMPGFKPRKPAQGHRLLSMSGGWG